MLSGKLNEHARVDLEAVETRFSDGVCLCGCMRTSSSVLVQLIKAEQRRANEVVLLWLLATIDDKYRRHTVCGAVLRCWQCGRRRAI